MALFGGVLHDVVDINNDDKDLLDVQFLQLLFLSARNVIIRGKTGVQFFFTNCVLRRWRSRKD